MSNTGSCITFTRDNYQQLLNKILEQSHDFHMQKRCEELQILAWYKHWQLSTDRRSFVDKLLLKPKKYLKLEDIVIPDSFKGHLHWEYLDGDYKAIFDCDDDLKVQIYPSTTFNEELSKLKTLAKLVERAIKSQDSGSITLSYEDWKLVYLK